MCVVKLFGKSIFYINYKPELTYNANAKDIIKANLETTTYADQIKFRPERLGTTLQQQRQEISGLINGGENSMFFLDNQNRKALKGMTKVEPKQKLDSPVGTLEQQRKDHLDLSFGRENYVDTLNYVNEKYLKKLRKQTNTQIGL